MAIPGFLFDVSEGAFQQRALMPLRDQVLLPGNTTTVRTSSAQHAEQLRRWGKQNVFLGAALLHPKHRWRQGKDETMWHKVGCLALITDVSREGGGWRVSLAGIGRVELGGISRMGEDDLPRMDMTPLPTVCRDEDEAYRELRDLARNVMPMSYAHPEIASDLLKLACDREEYPGISANRLVSLVATNDLITQQRALEELDDLARIRLVRQHLYAYMAKLNAEARSPVMRE
jgi:Lon protease-like protein